MFDLETLNAMIRSKVAAGERITIETVDDILLQIAAQAVDGCADVMAAAGAPPAAIEARTRSYRLELDQWRARALENIKGILQQKDAPSDGQVLH